jgi:hypothetical protein
VSPRQDGQFQGGFVDNLDELGSALSEKSLSDALHEGTPLNFIFPEGTRSHPVRDALLTLSFSQDEEEQMAASISLCQRLADHMDGRNKNCLLLITVHSGPGESSAEAILWMFSYDRVIQRSGGKVDLKDAFSLSSGLRKAASFSGSNSRTGFLSGVALDHQSSNANQLVAQFWISRFLEGSLQVQAREGTNLLAKAFRAANKALSNDELAQDQLVSTIIYVRANAAQPTTIASIGGLVPAGSAREAFARAAGSGPETRAPFAVDLERFDSRIKFRVFRLESGITVSAPFVEVSEQGGVQIEESVDGSRLIASGLIKSESIRSTS